MMPKLIRTCASLLSASLLSASCLLLAAHAFAQSTSVAAQPKDTQQATKPLAYEVVSIKPSSPKSNGSGMQSTPGSFTWTNVSLDSLIKDAYDVIIDSQLVGLPNWAREDGYDIAAKADQDTAERLNNLPRKERRKEEQRMKQSILADRCLFQAHEATKELPVYELVIGKGGLKMKDAPSDEPVTETMSSGQMTSHAMSIDAILVGFAGTDGRLIVDKTGLEDRKFDFELKWTPEEQRATASDDAAPSLFTALEEQLGLKLVPAKDPVRVLIVDHIERPSPN